MTKLANIISYIFNPIVFFLIMPYFIVFKLTSNQLYSIKWAIFSSVFIFIGMFLILFGRMKGVFSDIDVSIKTEREKLYFMLYVLSVIYLFVAIFFKGIFFPLSIIAVSIAIGTLIFNIVNKYIKASIHMATASAFITTITVIFGLQGFLATILIIPLLSWSRITLKRHTLQEVFIGGILGIVISLLTFLVWKYLYYT